MISLADDLISERILVLQNYQVLECFLLPDYSTVYNIQQNQIKLKTSPTDHCSNNALK